MFNIVCITNNSKILEKYLDRSLNLQNKKLFKKIYIKYDEKIKSLPKQFNNNLKKLSQPYTLIVHHDVEILEKKFFEKLNYFTKKIQDFGVIGFSGFNKSGFEISHMIDTNEYKNTIKKDYQEVVGCDDFCFLVKTDKLKFMKFNERISNFHLYAFDLSIRFQELGYKNYVINLLTKHNSSRKALDKWNKSIQNFTSLYGKERLRSYSKFHGRKSSIFNFFRESSSFRFILSFVINIFFWRFFEINKILKNKEIIFINRKLNINKQLIKIDKINNSIFIVNNKVKILKSFIFKKINKNQLLASHHQINNKNLKLIKKYKNIFLYRKIRLLVITKNSHVIPSNRMRFFDFEKKLSENYNIDIINFTSQFTDIIKYKNIFKTFFSLSFDYLLFFFKFFKNFKKSDVIIVHYSITPFIFPIFEYVIKFFLKKNQKLIYDADDINFKQIGSKELGFLKFFKVDYWGAQILINKSNYLIFGNSFLKKYYENKNSIPSVINPTPSTVLVKRKKVENKIYMGFIGYKSAFNRIIQLSLAFEELIKNNKDLRIIIIGAEKKLFKNNKNIIYLNYNFKNEKMFYEKVHIGLNPLEDNIINKYKSAGKLVRYINSNTFPISSAVGDCKKITKKNNGLIIKDFNNKKWRDEIQKILCKQKLNRYLKYNKFTYFSNKEYIKKINKVINSLKIN